MEPRDIEIIKKFMKSDEVLATLYQEHVELEQKLEKFNNKPYLTPQEELERKKMQKLKLRGRDMMENILQNYREHGE